MSRQRRTRMVVLAVALLLVVVAAPAGYAQRDALTPGSRVLLDAHNAYPENGRWADRIDRALRTGLPLAIEQDLVWVHDASGGRSIVSHGPPITGQEPSLREYLFERIRPMMEEALRAQDRERWPLITLNLDFKDDAPDHLRDVAALVANYESWLCTAERREDAGQIAPLQAGPLLVLTGESDLQERVFHDDVAIGGRLHLFGAVHRLADGGPGRRTNYRRWWNNAWSVVEPEGQPRAGAWTPEDEARLRTNVQRAHSAGLWIRFYTLDGFDPASSTSGWTPSYNFGSLEAAAVRWRAAISAGVDYVAVDQYEDFAGVRHQQR